jgi:hypothetical protein
MESAEGNMTIWSEAWLPAIWTSVKIREFSGKTATTVDTTII